MNNYLCGALATLFTFLMTALGSAAVFLLRGTLSETLRRAMLGFAAGVMTASSVWSLLLPAISRAEEAGTFPAWFPAAIGLTAGMLFLSALALFLPADGGAGEQERENILLAAALTLHNIPEGMAVGLAFAIAREEAGLWQAAALALGIGVQNIPEGAAISLPLHEHGMPRGRAFVRGALSAAVEPLFGIAVMTAAGAAAALMPWLLSFAAGAMLYVVVAELLPGAHSRSGTSGFAIGFLLMMILDVALG